MKPVVFKPKSQKDIVSIHHNMTVQELADAMGKDLGEELILLSQMCFMSVMNKTFQFNHICILVSTRSK